MNAILQGLSNRESELRLLDADELDVVSGGDKKAVAVFVQKCTISKDSNGNNVETCKNVSTTIL